MTSSNDRLNQIEALLQQSIVAIGDRTIRFVFHHADPCPPFPSAGGSEDQM